MSWKIVSFAAIIAIIAAVDVEIERPEVEYYDKKYYKYIKASVRRATRKSPYGVNIDICPIYTVGNNLTLRTQVLENLSGRYQPTLLIMQWKMCEFFEKEPYIGQMLAKQFPPNVSCPFQPGLIRLSGLVMRMDRFPYEIPFTWPFKTISARLDLTWLITNTKKIVAKVNFYGKVKLDKN